MSRREARGRALRSGDLCGRAWGPVDDELLAALPDWLRRRSVDDGEAIIPGRVYRRGPLLIKFFGPSGGVLDRLRPSRARRAAAMHFRLLPTPSPRPLVLLEQRRGGRSLAAVLVTEYLDGERFRDVFEHDPAARAALPAFLAGMHRRRLFHGDLNRRNLLWDGERWVLIDLDSMRHRLQSLLVRRQVRRVWSHLYAFTQCSPRLRPLFEAYLELMPLRWDRRHAWARVMRRARRLHRKWNVARR